VRLSIPLTGGVHSPRYASRAVIHYYSYVSAINAAWTAVIKTPGDYSGVTSINYSHNVLLSLCSWPTCRGSASLYVPPINYKREGTQCYRDRFLHTLTRTDSHTLKYTRLHTYSIQHTHSGGRVLCSGGLNHYNPSCAPMFIPHPHNRQTAKAPSSS
jgi:hypothetical protein